MYTAAFVSESAGSCQSPRPSLCAAAYPICHYSDFLSGKQVPYLPLPHRIGYAPKGAFNKEGITKLWKNPEVKPAVCEVGQGTLPAARHWLSHIFPCRAIIPPGTAGRRLCRPAPCFRGWTCRSRRLFRPDQAAKHRTGGAEALDFAVTELNLYLDTHPQDQEALGLYASYIKLAKEGREKYTAKYGLWTARSWFWRTATPGSMTHGPGS